MAGIAVARHGYGRPTRVIPMVEAGHPVPDAAGLESAGTALAMAQGAGADDLVLVLMSGGASANWIAPAGITFEREARREPRAAALGREHRRDEHGAKASLGDQGRAARARRPSARVITLAVSDVPGDDPAVIGSGPTVPDPATLADARAIVARYRLDLPEAVATRAERPRQRKPQARRSRLCEHRLSPDRPPGRCIPRRGSRHHGGAGYEVVFLGERLEGEAREVAAEHAALARKLQAEGPPRRDPLGRRTHRHDPQQGRPGRPQSGIRAGAGHRPRGHQRHRGAARATPTARTAGAARPTTRRARSWTEGRLRGRRNSASFRPRFSPTTTPPRSSSGWAICSKPDRPSPTSTTSAPSSWTALRIDSAGGTGAKPVENDPGKPNRNLPICGGASRRRCACLAALLSCAGTKAALADFRLCNNTGSRVGIALGYKDADGWTTEGWWNLAAAKLRDTREGSARRALLLRLRGRLRPRRRMVGQGLHVHARQGIHHPRHRGLPGARL